MVSITLFDTDDRACKPLTKNHMFSIKEITFCTRDEKLTAICVFSAICLKKKNAETFM